MLQKWLYGPCIQRLPEFKGTLGDLPDDELSYSITLKVESKIIGKDEFQLGAMVKKSMGQCFYTGDEVLGTSKGETTVEVSDVKEGMIGAKLLANFEESEVLEDDSARTVKSSSLTSVCYKRTQSKVI